MPIAINLFRGLASIFGTGESNFQTVIYWERSRRGHDFKGPLCITLRRVCCFTNGDVQIRASSVLKLIVRGMQFYQQAICYRSERSRYMILRIISFSLGTMNLQIFSEGNGYMTGHHARISGI